MIKEDLKNLKIKITWEYVDGKILNEYFINDKVVSEIFCTSFIDEENISKYIVEKLNRVIDSYKTSIQPIRKIQPHKCKCINVDYYWEGVLELNKEYEFSKNKNHSQRYSIYDNGKILCEFDNTKGFKVNMIELKNENN
jgi:hypothetical protein